MYVHQVMWQESCRMGFKLKDGLLPLISWHSCCYDFSDRLIGVKKLRP